MFGDDRVRGTREQMMWMQVVLVKLRLGAWASWGVLQFMFWKFNCKHYGCLCYFVFYKLWYFGLILVVIKF